MRGVEVHILDTADKSDPLNKCVVVGARIRDENKKLVAGWRARVDWTWETKQHEHLRKAAIEQALAALVESILEHPDGDPALREPT